MVLNGDNEDFNDFNDFKYLGTVTTKIIIKKKIQHGS